MINNCISEKLNSIFELTLPSTVVGQNVDRQNVDRQNVEQTKCRTDKMSTDKMRQFFF